MTALDEQIGGSHYKDMNIQPIEFIMKNKLGFAEGCIIKYICRHPFKGGIIDLQKAKQNIDFMIEHYYPEKSYDNSECCKQYHSYVVAHPFSEYSEESQKSLVKIYHKQCICGCHKETKDD